VTYGPNVFSDGRTDITSVFTHMLEKNRVREIRRGLTLTGPHRDEFLFTIDNRDVRKYGSRGEHKSALLSLKAAEIRLLGEKTETNPILLLDDLYAELDKGRGKNILCLFNQNSQTFITGTSLDFEVIKDICGNEKDRSFYFVRDGKVGYVIDE
jgi:DNA replication and repair protein RecF